MKYSESTIEKAVNMKLELKDNIYYTNPCTDRDVFKHKIKINENGLIICGCKWSQINLKKGVNKKMCSHSLAVLYDTNKNLFWKEVSKEK